MISLDSHAISVKEVELEPHFSETQWVTYHKRGWTLAEVRLGFEFGLCHCHMIAFKLLQDLFLFFFFFYICKEGDNLFHQVVRIDKKHVK